MKWMFKEDHALGKGGPRPGAAPGRTRRPPSPVSASAPRPPDSVCPARLVSGRTAACGPRRAVARCPGTASRNSWVPPRGGEGAGGAAAIPAGPRPREPCPLCLGHRRCCCYAVTNYEFCSQSTDVSSRQKSEPNTLTVSR